MIDKPNVYCSSCAQDHYLPKPLSVDYDECMICHKRGPCYTVSNAKIADYKENLFGRKVA